MSKLLWTFYLWSWLNLILHEAWGAQIQGSLILLCHWFLWAKNFSSWTHKYIEKVIADVRIQVRMNNDLQWPYLCRHQTQKWKLTLTLHKQKANMLTETSIHFSPDFISRHFWIWIFFGKKKSSGKINVDNNGGLEGSNHGMRWPDHSLTHWSPDP